MNIAIEGCLHGELDQVYSQLAELQKSTGIIIDALLICGDFQATRDQIDLDYMHCPPKYKSLGSFQKYYTGEKKTPYLTIFIGGNHEAVNYMRDLYFGGWVAPRIYYLGQAGSVYLRKGQNRIRISGLSGIYNDYDFKFGIKTERIPLMGKSRISCYHIKQIQVFRMELLARIQMMKKQNPDYGQDSSQFDIFLTHDWPQDMALYGDTQKLFQIKSFLKQQIEQSTLGCIPASRLLKLFQPSYWFSAHMHVKYAALFPHPQNKFTHFLALDKCLKNRSCIQILNFSMHKTQTNSMKTGKSQQVKLELDRTWLCVLKLTMALQLQNKSLYKIQNKGIKLIDANLMNSMIQKYLQNRDINDKNCHKFEQNLIKWYGQQQKGTQATQTIFLIENILMHNPSIFTGIIYNLQAQNREQGEQREHGQNEHKKETNDKHNDEIDLDL